MASVPVRALNALCNETPRNIQEWLTELTITNEPECIFILYAKSFLDITEQQHHLSTTSNYSENQTERIHSDSISCNSAPVKPKRCIARMMSSSSGHIMTASTPAPSMKTEKYRTTVCYQLDEAKKNTSIKLNPASISAFIRVKPCKDSDDNKTDKVESECNSVMSEISTKTLDQSVLPKIPVHSATASFSLTNRSLTPKISTKANGYRCRLRGKSQKSYRSQLQQLQKQREKETIENDRKPNNRTSMITDKTMIVNDSLPYSSAKSSSSKVDSNQWIAKPDDQSVSVASEQSRTCLRIRPNPSSSHNMSTNNNPDNCETTFVRQLDCFRNKLRNSSSIQNDSQSSAVTSVKFRKSPKTTISLQKKMKPDKRSDSANNYNRNQISNNQVSQKTASHGQVLLDAPPNSQAIKLISNVSRCSGYDTGDGIIESTSTGVTTSAAFESIDSSTNSSIDSGQGSTELNFQNCLAKDPLNYDKTVAEERFPSYARIVNTIDHVLRVCSTFHAAINDEISEKWTSNVICEAKLLIATIQCSPSFTFLSAHDIVTARRMISDLESEQNCAEKPANAFNFLIVLLRKIVHEVLIIFARIISVYLAECTNRDRLLIIALEHLIHLMLFGDEICHVIIQCGGLESLLYFCEVPSVSNGTLRLLLRALAILCGNYRGATKFLALNKFELIIKILFTSTIACSAEAAGILTQLTNPNQNYVRLGSIMPRVVTRILEIVDKSKIAESLLLALAALANITVQETETIDILYEHNAIKRIVQAYKRPKCHSVFIEEQLLTIFISLANGAYIEALIGQGAVGLLLSLLGTNSWIHIHNCRRIQIRATKCLRTIANHGIGLKAIHELDGYLTISKVMQDNNAPMDARNNLWWITEQLEKKYQIESAV
uniref:Insc_C domain-containing protein n=1 Tax=Loa loa TaxID=7209 RepID=A0A1I7V6Q7_LOALO